jgi:hypothetical protein
MVCPFLQQLQVFEIVYTNNKKGHDRIDKEVVISNDSCSFVKSKNQNITGEKK